MASVSVSYSVFSVKIPKLLSVALLFTSILLSGCATNPTHPTEKARSDTLLERQFAAAKSDSTVPRIWYAGFGLHSNSAAFKLDVASGARWISQLDPKAAVFTLTNPYSSQANDWPYANLATLQRTVAQMAANMKKDDVAVVLITTHGNVNVLAVNAAGKDDPMIRGQALAQILEPLANHRTVLIVSACFSGSLIPSLVSPTRIILTAAAHNRSSFGCQPKSTNTYFVEEFLKEANDSSKNLNQIFAAAFVAIDAKERSQRLSPPSLPQMRVPPLMEGFAQTPLKAWVGQKGDRPD